METVTLIESFVYEDWKTKVTATHWTPSEEKLTAEDMPKNFAEASAFAMKMEAKKSPIIQENPSFEFEIEWELTLPEIEAYIKENAL